MTKFQFCKSPLKRQVKDISMYDIIAFLIHASACLIIGLIDVHSFLFIDLCILLCAITFPRMLIGIVLYKLHCNIRIATISFIIRVLTYCLEMIGLGFNLISLYEVNGLDLAGTIVLIILQIASLLLNIKLIHTFWTYVRAGIDPDVYEKAKSHHEERKRDRSALNLLHKNQFNNGQIDYKKSLGNILGVNKDKEKIRTVNISDEESKVHIPQQESEIKIKEMFKHSSDENEEFRPKNIVENIKDEISNNKSNNKKSSSGHGNRSPALLNKSNRSQIFFEEVV
ncbi:unnamed protein product [Moneuplotes crassus]|uniref:Uncharacterized protein n=1 Tax=Euplotes crassus TaxID=5936 RepID=A0AAD1XJE1_EUPCR|nr:unnamed protein product [Moneuplotes crassus]